MKTLELTIWDRIQLDIAIPRNAPLDDIRVLLDILDKIRLTDEEKEAVGWQIIRVQTPQGPAMITDFDESAPALATASSIEFENAEVTKLCSIVKQRRNWPTQVETLELKARLDNG